MMKGFIRKIAIILCFALVCLAGCQGDLSGHKCAFDQKVESEEFLKSKATCESVAKYYYSCSCGKHGEETFEVGQKLKHTYTAEVVGEEYLKTPANCKDKAVYVKSCVHCGKRGYDFWMFTYGEVGECSFTQEIPASAYLKTEATYTESAVYYKSCVCGKTGEETFLYGGKLRDFKNRNVLILGDSYSTYTGQIPSGYATWYPKLDVDTVEETWWSKFIESTQSTLVQNNSWSGSPICYTGYNGVDCSKSSSFIYRYKKLKQEGFFTQNTVDTVLVFGGTNDSWAEVQLGAMQYFDWSESDLFKVLPAICYLTYTLKTDLPNAEIVLIINTDIKKEIQDCMESAAQYYGVKSVRLKNIDKLDDHPTVAGMQAISDQVWNALKYEE